MAPNFRSLLCGLCGNNNRRLEFVPPEPATGNSWFDGCLLLFYKPETPEQRQERAFKKEKRDVEQFLKKHGLWDNRMPFEDMRNLKVVLEATLETETAKLQGPFEVIEMQELKKGKSTEITDGSPTDKDTAASEGTTSDVAICEQPTKTENPRDEEFDRKLVATHAASPEHCECSGSEDTCDENSSECGADESGLMPLILLSTRKFKDNLNSCDNERLELNSCSSSCSSSMENVTLETSVVENPLAKDD
ncbi:uncharacterized protein LOC129758120 [Uranotaenia lowii]|uniref:uncharacterized protein LOC129758120 n=1 Tax=Uranotaenia lowii TaxID=190385 RepID=UPI0024798EE8|nr:uncharacterized protein LOC129758120 [Uranotaenia lowii]